MRVLKFLACEHIDSSFSTVDTDCVTVAGQIVGLDPYLSLLIIRTIIHFLKLTLNNFI